MTFPERSYCDCVDPLLYQWRGDREWWSCMNCDGRVREMTEVEKAKHVPTVLQACRDAARSSS